jgi:hypothetical protein
MRRFLAIALSLALLGGCADVGNIVKKDESSISINDISIAKVNRNIALQLPIEKRLNSNKLKITQLFIYPDKKKNRVRVEFEFIFYSFKIPEGLRAVARVSSDLVYDPKSQTFRLKDFKNIQVKYFKPSLIEYISKEDEKFIRDSITSALENIVLAKSKKPLKSLKGFKVYDKKIKVIFD